MYTQIFDPVGGSLGLSVIFAALPLLTIFVLLGVLKMKAQWAALISLAVSLLVAVLVYRMPVGQALDSGAEGAAFGLFPIMWIVVAAIWIYTMTVATGHFDVLRLAFGAIAVPIITLARVTGLPLHELSSMVGRQTPVLALFVPLVLVFMVDGRRGLRQTWLPAVVGGVVFAVAQFLSSNYLSVELTDIVASLTSAAAIV